MRIRRSYRTALCALMVIGVSGCTFFVQHDDTSGVVDQDPEAAGRALSGPIEDDSGALTQNDEAATDADQPGLTSRSDERVDFARHDPEFRFSALIPHDYAVEYVPAIRAISIFDPAGGGISDRENSQILIRFFEADQFLTLSTVDILDREEVTVHGREAVRYEILKKSGVAPFPDQPSWRNEQHKLIDVRLADQSPSLFYVFAYNPDFSAVRFEEFIGSILFHNDPKSFVAPMDRFQERINKKPFGIFITPENSPVEDESFRGYHTAADLEVFPDELGQAVPVHAVCGGPLRQVRTATGYGGVVVQECLLDDAAMTVVYGHVDIRSVSFAVGAYVLPGETIGILGEDKSAQSGGERKHLHLGIHRGGAIDIRGYVPSEQELSAWLDPATIIP